MLYESRRAYFAEYNSRPEVKAKKAAHNARPEYKAQKAGYRARPESKAQKAASSAIYNVRPESKARRAEQRARPENKALADEYRDRPENIAKEKLRRQTPESKAKDAAYHAQPNVQARQAEHYNLPETKAKEKLRKATPEYKAQRVEHNARPEIMTKKNNRKRERYANDPAYKLSEILRSRLRQAIRNKSTRGSAVRLLGCTIEEAIAHLGSLFVEGMTWENWGVRGWHIDHKLPLCSFDLEDPAQLAVVCHYLNLQPLWATDNLSKSGRVAA